MQYTPITIENLISKITPLLMKYDIQKAAVFGSCARGDMQKGSDVDILVDFDSISSGMDFIALKQQIEKKLSRKVDLISYKSLNFSNAKAQILSEMKVIYER